jgi:hypothetical protein
MRQERRPQLMGIGDQVQEALLDKRRFEGEVRAPLQFRLRRRAQQVEG